MGLNNIKAPAMQELNVLNHIHINRVMTYVKLKIVKV